MGAGGGGLGLRPQGHPQMLVWAEVWKGKLCVVCPQGLPRQWGMVLEAGTLGSVGDSLQMRDSRLQLAII